MPDGADVRPIDLGLASTRRLEPYGDLALPPPGLPEGADVVAQDRDLAGVALLADLVQQNCAIEHTLAQPSLKIVFEGIRTAPPHSFTRLARPLGRHGLADRLPVVVAHPSDLADGHPVTKRFADHELFLHVDHGCPPGSNAKAPCFPRKGFLSRRVGNSISAFLGILPSVVTKLGCTSNLWHFR